MGRRPRDAASAKGDVPQLVSGEPRRKDMSSRDEIFASIRANKPKLDRPLPVVPLFDESRPESLLASFKESLERMGGTFLDLPSSGDHLAPVRDKIANAKVVCS